MVDKTGVVNALPVNKRMPPVAASYHLKLGLLADEAAVNTVLVPEQIAVVPVTPLMVGIGLTVTATAKREVDTHELLLTST